MSLPHLLLGLLSVDPLSGYDLNKQFNTSLQHFWTTDQSQIYRALHRMKADGWVTIERVAQSNNPDKKVYHLTEAGRAAPWIFWILPMVIGVPAFIYWEAQYRRQFEALT